MSTDYRRPVAPPCDWLLEEGPGRVLRETRWVIKSVDVISRNTGIMDFGPGEDGYRRAKDYFDGFARNAQRIKFEIVEQVRHITPWTEIPKEVRGG